VVPRRGESDYDHEEATTLDPFVIHDEELVVVPKAGGAESIREDLRADPDVQDALRWLDPPSNAGPPAAVAAAAPLPGEAYAPPAPHPGAPPYAVYTPLPQPYPGAGPYPTPVPSYVPNSGAYYLPMPMPGPAAAPAPARSPVLWILLSAMVTGGGIVLGWWLFSGVAAHERPASRAVAPQPQPQQVQPQPQQVPPQPPPPQQPQPQPAPQPAKPARADAVTGEVTKVAQADSAAVLAPTSGEISKVFLSAPRQVEKGDKLVELRSESGGGGAKAKKLAARVAELERLAKNDPVYEEFLDKARKEQKAAEGQVVTTVIKANAAGMARLEVKEGDAVSGHKPVAYISKGGDWTLTATAKSEVQQSWSCSLQLTEGKKAACTIQKVIATSAGSELTVTVGAADAPWLADASQTPTITFGPRE
jgi:biotin carboxyl carrier protein